MSVWKLIIAFVVVASLMLPSHSPGQGKGVIKGTVRGGNTGQPIEGVEVSALRKENGKFVRRGQGMTNQEGNYEISRLPADSYKLRFDDRHGDYRTSEPNKMIEVRDNVEVFNYSMPLFY
ncbi:MAG TPA: carboxypeptidase-like regulatory domain-containing protein [Pyrinomonadaceae bacterium]|jgi:5-hydroxyisourate hydrolase-like protein (transthyretin family)